MAKQMNAQSQFDRVTEITKQLEEGIQTLFESEKFKTWLTTMSRFHDYSLNRNGICFPYFPGLSGNRYDSGTRYLKAQDPCHD